MLRFPLIHPPLLAALGAAGHGARVLIADANYSHSTNVHPGAALIHLNLRPGLVTVEQVLEPVLAAVPVEAAAVMRPDDGSTPLVFGRYSELLGGELPLQPLGRHEFYAACRQPDLAVCVATGDGALYANILLTIGYIRPN
ncbi:MAG TPA: RbsD/FucU domain-containing protein [Streptosporangiaceae bacterium]|nr:RbsD/FucU domain-containing protein [Streptosporangiaceae bacterium]